MIDWRIYYDTGSTFDSSQGTPEQAPPYGVICIVQLHKDNGRTQLHRWDWYYYKKDEKCWYGSDIHGLLDQLCHDTTGSICAVRQGRTVMNNIFAAIMLQASNDADFPVQSAKDALEDPSMFVGRRSG